MARTKLMSTVAKKGTRLEQLQLLRDNLALQIDNCNIDPDNGMRLMPQLSKQYRETIKEIEEIERLENSDDEIGDIIASRNSDGKSNAVR